MQSTAPTAPQNVAQTGITHTTITITWTPPIPPNGEIESYSIEYSSEVEGTLNVTGIPPSIFQYQLTGLMEYVNYTIVVYAHTDKGRGDGSDPITVETNEHCKPLLVCLLFTHCLMNWTSTVD